MASTVATRVSPWTRARASPRVARPRPRVAAPVRGGGGGGSFRVIEYGDGTTPDERRAASAGREDDRGDRDRPGRGRGARGGPRGRQARGRGSRGRRDDYYRDDDEEDFYDDRRPRGRGSLRERGRGGRGVRSQRGFRDGAPGDDAPWRPPSGGPREDEWRASDRRDRRFDDDFDAPPPRAPRFPRRERGGVRFGDGFEDDRFEDDDHRGGYRDDRGGYGFSTVDCAGQEGRVIGKGGGMIAEIQERTGAHLSVRKDLGVVEVEGGDVAAAEAEIRRIVEDGRRSDAASGRNAAGPGARRGPGGTETPPRREYYEEEAYGGRDEEGYGYDSDDSDDDWILEGLEDELADAAAWAGGHESRPGRYRPELLSKYVDEAFEPLVYVREPDDADEYNFFAGSRFKQLGASEAAEKAVNEMGIERPSHIQALTYGWLSGEKDASGPDEAEFEAEAEASASVETSAGDPVASPTASPGALLMADQAGSGKTLAYLLPLLQRLQAVERTAGRAAPNRPRLLVLCPTSELVVQVLGVARALARGGLRCRSLAMTGGNEGKTQTRALKEGVDVVIGTPGRVAHLVEVGKLETRDLLAVVVDECDVLLGDSFEFAEQVRPLKEACETQGGCFTRFVLVTATIPEDVLRQLRAFFDGSLKVLQGPGLHRPAAGLLERLVDCSGGDVVDDQSGFYRKYRALEQLLDAEREKGEAAAKRMLLFCNKIETCRRVENLLRRSDREGKTLVPLPYHAALTRERREASLGEFLVPPKKGDVPLMLVCTDRASRGLDASFVKHVVLFDFPRDPSEYVRRVGRTARGALGTGEVSVLVLGRQVRLAREIMRRNTRGDPVESTPQY